MVTADTGPESLLVVWNVRTGLPLRTVSSPHRHGVSTMDVSADGAWLATVSAADPDTGEQEVGREEWPRSTHKFKRHLHLADQARDCAGQGKAPPWCCGQMQHFVFQGDLHCRHRPLSTG